MYKYKVGDKVRVKMDLKEGHEYAMRDERYKRYFNDSMYRRRGKLLTIRCTVDGYYRVQENSWEWTDSMFEPLKEENEI